MEQALPAGMEETEQHLQLLAQVLPEQEVGVLVHMVVQPERVEQVAVEMELMMVQPQVQELLIPVAAVVAAV
jgi:hypothetical protein